MLRNYRRPYQIVIYRYLLLIGMLVSAVHPAVVQAQSGAVSRSELILAMNTLRVSQGLPPLIEDPIVNAVAQGTAEIMAANNMSWHIGDVRGRLAAAGYGGGATVWATENFAMGSMGIDEIMQTWADPDHMRPAVIPAYCHVGAGVAQAADGTYYYILQAAYASDQACGEYKSVSGGDPGNGVNQVPPVSQVIIPVKIATPGSDGRIYHIVQSGQSFWSIAIAYQITIRDLEVWNNLSRDVALLVGEKLFIPSSGTAGYATPTPVGMVLLATPGSDGKIIHAVQPYQALITIASAYKVKVGTILALNGLQVDWPLQIGQQLLIDPGSVTPSPTPRPLSAIEKITPASDGSYYHTTKSGENLVWIADLYEITLSELMAWNGLSTESILQPGQKLLLRITPPATATQVPAQPTITAAMTSTPVTPTQATPTAIRASATAIASAIETPSAETQSGFSSMSAVIVGILVVTVLLVVGWILWHRE
jgi:LysM repeat protein